MKNKSFQSPVQSTPVGGDAPATSEAAKTARELAVLTVPDCDFIGQLADFCDELLSVLASVPKCLIIRFVGPHEISPDSALVIYDILATERNGVKVITDAWSPLLGSSLLVWLAGDVRRLRSTTHFRFLSLQGAKSSKFRRPPWENDFAALDDAELEDSPMVTDYKTVLRLINQYLPVDEFAGKTITPEMLEDFGLLENSPLDALLNHCLPGTSANPNDLVAEPKAVLTAPHRASSNDLCPAPAPSLQGNVAKALQLAPRAPSIVRRVLGLGFAAKELIRILEQKCIRLAQNESKESITQTAVIRGQIKKITRVDMGIDMQYECLRKLPARLSHRREPILASLKKRKFKLEQLMLKIGFSRQELMDMIILAKHIDTKITAALASSHPDLEANLQAFESIVRMPLPEFHVLCESLPGSENMNGRNADLTLPSRPDRGLI